jgi:hypothetical protein
VSSGDVRLPTGKIVALSALSGTETVFKNALTVTGSVLCMPASAGDERLLKNVNASSQVR